MCRHAVQLKCPKVESGIACMYAQDMCIHSNVLERPLQPLLSQNTLMHIQFNIQSVSSQIVSGILELNFNCSGKFDTECGSTHVNKPTKPCEPHQLLSCAFSTWPRGMFSGWRGVRVCECVLTVHFIITVCARESREKWNADRKKGFCTINAHCSPYFIFYSVFITQTPKWNHTDWVSVCLTVCTCCCCSAMWGVYTKDSSMWLPVIWLFQELVIQQRCNPSLPKQIQLYLTLSFL